MLSYQDAAAEIMEHLCSHSTHGYSQPNRQGIGTGGNAGETVTLSDGTRVAISTGDRDCSSAAIECYAALGVDVGGATYTGNMRGCMTRTGNFRWITDLGQRRRGDILLNERHHTAVYLGDGRLGQFSISETGGVSGQRGDQTARESNVRAYYNYPWDGILRYCGPSRGEEDEVNDQDKKDIAYQVWAYINKSVSKVDAYQRQTDAHYQLTRTDNAGHDNPAGHDLYGRVNIIEHNLSLVMRALGIEDSYRSVRPSGSGPRFDDEAKGIKPLVQ